MKKFNYVFDNSVAKKRKCGELLCFFTYTNLYNNF